MRNNIIIIAIVTVAALATACNGVKREPGKIYMPDMAYSRAYETYADHSNLNRKGISYNNQPVAGAVSRSDNYVYHIAQDEGSDTSSYYNSRLTENPVTELSKEELVETERQYLINCGICHGTKLDGNGPLWKGGDGPFPAKPATLVGDPKYTAMTAGTMYYSITYGRNLMGSYASQLTPEQRWNIVYYIKNKQAPSATTTTASTDSTAKK